ncbi:MAG TPA: hypothetical protein DCQ28_12820, partial [Bacteroidetes bacterium]|nr:hypothetical protein [Bacteroidota bacterium]
MYIGDVSARGLHHLVYEIVDNSIDEALAGYCKEINVKINKDGSVSVLDDGRGIPTDMHKEEKRSALEVVLTVLHAGGKFDKNTYKVSGGLHGVGLSVVNALSEWLEVTVKLGGKVWYQKYKQGDPVAPVKIIGNMSKTDKTGTTVMFMPDGSIFKNRTYKFDTLAERLRELAFLNPEVTLEITDLRNKQEQTEKFHYEGGLKEFVKYTDSTRPSIMKKVFYAKGEGKDENNRTVEVEAAFQYNDQYSENMFSYVNNINTHEGGTHLVGFRTAITRSLNNFASKNNLVKDDKIQLTGEDFKEGLTAVISVKVPEPQFEGQTKTKLGNSEIKGLVESLVNEKVAMFFEENPAIAKKILSKAVDAARARFAARKARDMARSKGLMADATLPGKLAECQNSEPSQREIFLVEGD